MRAANAVSSSVEGAANLIYAYYRTPPKCKACDGEGCGETEVKDPTQLRRLKFERRSVGFCGAEVDLRFGAAFAEAVLPALWALVGGFINALPFPFFGKIE